jgi:hypothetical protein
MFAGERLGRRTDQRHRGIGNLSRLRHPANAGLAALGHVAGVGSRHRNPVGDKLRKVTPRGRVFPHHRIHGGCDQHRLVGGKQNGGGKIIGEPIRHLGHQVSRRRRHDDEIGVAGEPDMADVEFGHGVE